MAKTSVKRRSKKLRRNKYKNSRIRNGKARPAHVGGIPRHQPKHRIRKQERERLENEQYREKQEEVGKEKKESWLEKIFRKIVPDEAAKIRRRDIGGKKEAKLIKGLLKEKGQDKPETEEAELKIAKPKSKNLKKCYKSIDGARGAAGINKIDESKKLYLKAINLYLGLEYHEKREVYGELMELYNRLAR